MAATKIRLKLMIEKSTNKVIFAEAEKDFVEVLFRLLALPIGTGIKVMSNEFSYCCLGNLRKSFENLVQPYLKNNTIKSMPLKSGLTAPLLFDLLLMTDDDAELMKRKFYYCCNGGHSYVTVKEKTTCPSPSCLRRMDKELQLVGSSKVITGSEILQGILGKSATYMVTDDLCVTPVSSMISSVNFLQKNVKDINVLEERVVDIGNDEVLQLLEASFQSNETLTNVFLVKKEKEKEKEKDLEYDVI